MEEELRPGALPVNLEEAPPSGASDSTTGSLVSANRKPASAQKVLSGFSTTFEEKMESFDTKLKPNNLFLIGNRSTSYFRGD